MAITSITFDDLCSDKILIYRPVITAPAPETVRGSLGGALVFLLGGAAGFAALQVLAGSRSPRSPATVATLSVAGRGPEVAILAVEMHV